MRTVAYFHTDHFEPWRLAAIGGQDMERCVAAVEAYAAKTAPLDFARKASLFHDARLNYLVSAERPLRRAHPGDLLGFVPRSERERAIGKAILAPLVASSHELHIHLRHGGFTYNDTGPDPETAAYLQTPRGRASDDARLELAVRLTLDALREDGGLDLARWFFIHGRGALNAADPHECAVVREIEILRRNGCLGDFSQPSNRTHGDSRIEIPYLVDPVASAKGYDSPAASPAAAAGAGGAGRERFFLWASAMTHRSCSIDTFSPFVQARVKTPEATALAHARAGVVIGDVLYVKTHGHSLHPAYQKGARVMPHLDPGVQAELRALFHAADAAGVGVEFLTVTEVYERILAAPPAPAGDLAAQFNLGVGSPMAPFGLTVDFLRADGVRSAPPPVDPRPDTLPAPSIVAPPPSPDAAAETLPPVAHVVPLRRLLSRSERPSAMDAILDAHRVLPDLLAAPDVRLINETAGRIAQARAAELGAEGSGVTGFYGRRAAEQTLLQPSEVMCAAFVEQRLPGVHAVYEIGCGLGVLSTLLALRGFRATGVERNGARVATADTIAEGVLGEASAPVGPPLFMKGLFPKVVRRRVKLAASVALVTNLLGTASTEEQERFIGGLRAFGAVVIDVTRFYARRTTRRQIRELEEIFTLGGFEAPRVAFDLGQDGRYLLFTNPRPRRRAGMEAVLASIGMVRDEPLFATA